MREQFDCSAFERINLSARLSVSLAPMQSQLLIVVERSSSRSGQTANNTREFFISRSRDRDSMMPALGFRNRERAIGRATIPFQINGLSRVRLRFHRPDVCSAFPLGDRPIRHGLVISLSVFEPRNDISHSHLSIG